MNNTFYAPNDYRYYLEHHGIKGMKWGIRRWQDQNGRYNAAGRERYGIGDGRTYAGVKGGTGSTPSSKSLGSRVASSVESKAAQVKSVISKAQAMPLSEVKKYVETYALGKNTVDTYLKAGVEFSRVQSFDTFEKYAFYATYKKHDENEYAGMFGKNLMKRANAVARQAENTARKTGLEEDIAKAKELREQANNMNIYKLKISATKKLKVPSDENAGNVVADLLKDNEFRSDLSKSIDHAKAIMRRPSQQALFADAQSIMNKRGELTSKERQTLYRALNLTLVNHDSYETAVQDKFYGALKKKGYSALVDINDKEYSSYHAHRPMIVFDTDSVKLQSVTKMNRAHIEVLNGVYNVERIAKDIPANAFGVPTQYGEAGFNIAKRTVEQALNDYLELGENAS